jgi:hypothetical protein
MKRFIHHTNGSLQIHQNTPFTIVPTYRQGKKEYDLIIGALGLEGTEQILLSSSDAPNTVSVDDFNGNIGDFEAFVDEQEMKTQQAKIEAFLRDDPLGQRLVHEVGLQTKLDGETIILSSSLFDRVWKLTKEELGGVWVFGKTIEQN